MHLQVSKKVDLPAEAYIFIFCSQPLSSCNLVLLVHPLVMRSRKSVQDSRIGAMPSLQVTQVKRTCNCFKSCCWTVSKQTTETGQGPPGTQAPCGEVPGDTAKAHKTTFFFTHQAPKRGRDQTRQPRQQNNN